MSDSMTPVEGLERVLAELGRTPSEGDAVMASTGQLFWIFVAGTGQHAIPRTLAKRSA